MEEKTYKIETIITNKRNGRTSTRRVMDETYSDDEMTILEDYADEVIYELTHEDFELNESEWWTIEFNLLTEDFQLIDKLVKKG